ncbi:MAG TPA: BCCT family transporter [Pseudogracilibacillus sp.]|nr:BCCT family transporter [Pseudogracilibacillus sp.]
MSTSQQDANKSNKQTLGKVFYISTAIIALFVLWGAIAPNSLEARAGSALEWMITNFGWFYMLITAFFVLFVIILAISPFGKIRLGKQDEKPEFSWISWIGMLFAAGIGVGFVFFGVAEPLLYYNDPPVGIEPGTRDAALAGLRYGSYHWAFHPWAIFSIVGLTLAYVQFKKGKPALISSAFYPLLGNKTDGKLGQTIDVLAVLATCTGVATTFGLSAMQITGGLSFLSSIPNTITVQLIIIAIVTICFMISASTGLDKGIKILSNTNIGVAGILMLFILIFGPTLFIADSFVTTLGGYVSNVVPMSLTLTPFSESDWLGKNTIFFWAWHIAWAPFMGLFIARISRGRTVRQFITGVLLVPSVIAILWFSTFGGTALNLDINHGANLGEIVNDNVELSLFAMLEHLPLSAITSVIGVILIFIFFITSADSATYVLSSMTTRGSLMPPMKIKIIWGLLIAGTASILLITGDGGLDALQTASLIAALPFAIVMIFLIISLLMMFNRDYKLYRRQQASEERETVKEEFRDEFLEDITEEVIGQDQFTEVVTDQLKDEFVSTAKDEWYGEVKEEVYDEIKDNAYDEVKEDVYDEIKDKAYDEVKEDVYDEIKDKAYDEVKDDVYDVIKDKAYDEVKEDVYDKLKDEAYQEMKDDVYDELKDKAYEAVKDDVYDELKDKAYEAVKDDVYDELKDKAYEAVKDDLYEEIKEKTYDEVKENLKKELIDEIKDEISDDLKK